MLIESGGRKETKPVFFLLVLFMAKKSIIKLQDVWKTYCIGTIKVNALCGLNLDIYDGEFIVIQGPSGSGKSTLMNIIGCLDIPTKGRVSLAGQDISLLSESDLASIRGKQIGFIFQTFNLLPALSALENVMLPMTFQGVPKHERFDKAKFLLELVGLGDRLNHKPSELSGGQGQRVAIARSLANNPKVILADEPTGNLDSISGRLVMNHLKMLNRKEKKTVIVVTHDLSWIKYADRVVHIMDGDIKSIEMK